MWYTVFYLERVGTAGHLGYITHVITGPGRTLKQALEERDVCMSQVNAVIPGHHQNITSDWDKL